MIKIKLYTLAIGLISLTMANAQKKVGIGTETPQQTLDVNGTMGIRELPKASKADILAWDENTQQVVTTPSTEDTHAPFYLVNLLVPVGGKVSANGSFELNGIQVPNLAVRINPSKYTATITNYNLLKYNDGDTPSTYFNMTYKSQRGVYFPVMVKNLLKTPEDNLHAIIARRNSNVSVGAGNKAEGRILRDVPNSELSTATFVEKQANVVEVKEPYMSLTPSEYGNHYVLKISFPQVEDGLAKYYYEGNGSTRGSAGFMPWAENSTNYEEAYKIQLDTKYAWLITLFVINNDWIKK